MERGQDMNRAYFTPGAVHVCLNAFDAEADYCAPDSAEAAGWSVYARRMGESEAAGFTVIRDAERASRAEAEALAEHWAAELGAEIRLF